jgi:hypothetical protein
MTLLIFVGGWLVTNYAVGVAVAYYGVRRHGEGRWAARREALLWPVSLLRAVMARRRRKQAELRARNA